MVGRLPRAVARRPDEAMAAADSLRWRCTAQIDVGKARVAHDELGAARDTLATNTAPVGVTYGSDMRLLVNVGRIPTVLFGASSVHDCHGPDESVAVAEVVGAAQTLVVAAMRYCGVSGDAPEPAGDLDPRPRP